MKIAINIIILRMLFLSSIFVFLSVAKAQEIKETFEKETLYTPLNGPIKKVKRINSILMDHTREDSAHYSLLITGRPEDRVGFSRSVAVKPGDTVHLKVYAKYISSKQMKSGLTRDLMWNVLSMVITGVNRSGMEQMLKAYSPQNTSLITIGLDNNDDDRPAGYLNWIIFNENYELEDGGYIRMSSNSNGHLPVSAHELLSSGKLPMSSKGYLFTYLSNEREQDVYFDDFSIEQVLAVYIDTEGDENILTESGQYIVIE